MADVELALSFTAMMLNKFIKNKIVYFILIVMAVIIYMIISNQIKDIQDKKFYNNFISKVKKGELLDKIIKENYADYYGDDLRLSYFFMELGEIAIEMLKEDKKNIKIMQVVLNEQPSNPFQLNGDWENDKKIYYNIKASTRDKRFKTMKIRWEHTQEILKLSLINKVFSFYITEGVCQETLLENIKKYPNLKAFKKPKETFYHYTNRLNNKGQFEKIQINDKGQVWVFQNLKTGSFLIFREEGGEQAHNVGISPKPKRLVFYGFFRAKRDFKEYRENEIYDLFSRFNLLKEIF